MGAVTSTYSSNGSQRYQLSKRPWRLNVTDFHRILDHYYEGSGTTNDPYIVEWLENDPENPKAYSEILRWSVTALIATMTLGVALASSAYSGTIGPLIAQFQCSEVIILGLSLMVLGYAVGPVLWAPISESVGRRNIFLAYSGYTVFTAGCCGSQNVWTPIILRFFTGLFGSSSLCIPGGQIADMFKPELPIFLQRALVRQLRMQQAMLQQEITWSFASFRKVDVWCLPPLSSRVLSSSDNDHLGPTGSTLLPRWTGSVLLPTV
ncbi:hypothetical protein BDV59DRAFT_40638 [Aspergillus ambiguus]|uniref:uncharacterized protein n=1 Tax=Aspergillus ambiguus TaxID=176160 RepID=UPI003CCE4339